MSLIGSLEDLSLGDILQIISLSQKSGVLVLRTNEGEGRIVFRGGLVCGAVAKDGPRDLRGVLVDGGFVDEAAFDAASASLDGDAAGPERDERIAAALTEADVVSAERIDSLRREAVEAAVVAMFRWDTGDFSFDVREEREPEDPALLLAVGVNAQYLAMEGARCDDEDGARDEAAFDAIPASEMFGVVSDEPADEPGETPAAFSEPELSTPAPEVPEALLPSIEASVAVVAEAAVERADRREPEIGPFVEAPVEPEAEPPVVSTAQIAAMAPEPTGFDRSRPVIAIDVDLPALEWVKQSLAPACERIHIFQRSDLGLTRIRQYLARAVAPVVLLSPATPGDRLSGIEDASDFVRRLKQQAPMLRVIWLQEDGVVALAQAAPADAIAIRPPSHVLRSDRAPDASGERAADLRELVLRIGSDRGLPDEASPALPSEALEELKLATERLRDASMRGEVLSVAIEFASRSLRRVAMFMVRDATVVGIAQHQLSLCGGPDDHGLRAFEMPVADSRWLSRVVDEREPVVGAPEGPGDLRLAEALGDRPPVQAYLAPIESGGDVVAVLYGDDLPGGAAPADTSALEVVLHHAGLALERALLERALARESG